MPRLTDSIHAKVPGWLPALLLVATACAAFLAGRYIGQYDAEKSNDEKRKFVEAGNSADRLLLYGTLLDQIREGRVDRVTRVLELKARMDSSRAAACLDDALCAVFAAATPEERSRLQSLVSKYRERQMDASGT